MQRPLSRSSIRQKTADGHDEGAKIHEKKTSVMCSGCYRTNTERKGVFSLAQLFTRNLHMGLVRSYRYPPLSLSAFSS